ncbi:MAG: cytochrome C [Chitinophagaceae bacterium]|nr:MAG: cytochrome C [Chitinophagaceae bacterium]
MEKRLRVIAANTLIVLNVFILFLLLFENRLVIPAWLQVFGRMHPLLLHFPLVMLVIAMALEFFRFPTKHQLNEFYERFASYLLVAGAVLAGVTVVMGLFLSREEGYEGDVLDWHKWAGVAVMFFSSLVYLLRGFSWYNRLLARVSAVVLLVLLLVTGHYGAVLTHGDDFLLAPVMEQKVNEPVAFEQAEVFTDVIQPIFQGKCVSCHNPSKSKGALQLTDSVSILKGGKTGKLFDAGHPELSLLLQRIHLPEGDKKRMPPVGKPQLTPTEIELLTLWISAGGMFSRKLVDLPETDSLRQLAAPAFTSATKKEYAFEPADPALVKKLNNEYRVITPVALGSPALNVNIFNSSNYTSKVLQELAPLSTQVVSINLAKMPVKDADLETIGKLFNLEVLNLNFTGVTGAGLKQLAPLARLQSLSLSGTDITLQDLDAINPLTQLKHLSVWETKITPQEIESFRKSHPAMLVNAGSSTSGDLLKLNLPQLENEVNVFSDQVVVKLKHPVKAVQMRYSVDGTPVDSIRSPLYEDGKIVITKNSTIKVRAFKPGWIGSDEVSYGFYQGRFRPDSFALLTPVFEVYKSAGVKTLFDQRLGNPANYYSGTWLGFSRNNAEIVMKFDQPAAISSISFNTYQAPYRELFAPMEMEVWSGDGPGKFRLVKTVRFAEEKDKQVLLLQTMFPKTSFRYMKLVIKPRMVLPGKIIPEKKGLYPVMLVDEILLN